MRFHIKNTNLFKLPGNSHMLHLGTIGYSPPFQLEREFIVMACVAGPHAGKCYIEEVVLNSVDFKNDVFANLKFIDDDNLAYDLAKYAEEKGLTDVKKRTEELADKGRLQWLAKGSSMLSAKPKG